MRSGRKAPSNPKFSDLSKNSSNYSDKFSGDSRIPRTVVSTQPLRNARYTIKTRFPLRLTGQTGTLYYNNYSILCTPYRPFASTSYAWGGATQLSQKYLNFYAVKQRAVLTLSNTLTTSCYVAVITKRAPPANSQVTLQTDYLLPQSRRVILGSIQGGASTKSISHSLNVSNLYGYDITSSSQSNHTCTFSSDPSYTSGLMIIIMSVDAATVPILDCWVDLELDIIGIFPVDLLA